MGLGERSTAPHTTSTKKKCTHTLTRCPHSYLLSKRCTPYFMCFLSMPASSRACATFRTSDREAACRPSAPPLSLRELPSVSPAIAGHGKSSDVNWLLSTAIAEWNAASNLEH